MVKILLYLLDKIPYMSKFGLSIADELKIIYYHKKGQFKQPEKCLCGGIVITHTWQLHKDDISWETACQSCDQVYDED